MDLFPDGAHVRLRSRVRGTYLHADEDGVGVSLDPLGASVNAAWRVHVIAHGGTPYVLLHGAAYGRYLAATDEPAASGHLGDRVVQRLFDDHLGIAFPWSAVDAGYEDDVLLHHITHRFLRANGDRVLVPWLNDVTVDCHRNLSMMMHWVVEDLRPRPEPPVLPDPVPDASQGGGFLGLFSEHTEPMLLRTIRYVREDEQGNFNELDWATFQFQGRSVSVLREEVARHVGVEVFFNITVCARAGRYGRLTPLTTDLPRSQEPMDIIALTTGSQAAEELQYPDVDALNIDGVRRSPEPVDIIPLPRSPAAEELQYPDVDALNIDEP